MAHLSTREITATKPIGESLNAFRDSFKLTCKDLGLLHSVDAVHRLDNEGLRNLSLDLISTLQVLPAARQLRSRSTTGVLRDDLVRYAPSIVAGTYNRESVITLCERAVGLASDTEIWNAVYDLVTETTPPRPLPFLGQTPISRNTSSLYNSSEFRRYTNNVLREELGSIYVGIPGFYDAFFGGVEGLEAAGAAVFGKCKEGDDPLYSDKGGWQDWPKSAKENEVLEWLSGKVRLFGDFARDEGFNMITCRTILAQPDRPLEGSIPERKLDVCFINVPDMAQNSKHHWSHVLVPGELKSNRNLDTSSKTWYDLGRYVREVFAAQDTRCFVLGFTLCESIMRLWEFDRLGAIASAPFDINKDGKQFILAMLGYLWLNDEQLGFDPTIISSKGKRFIEIIRDGRPERLILDKNMKRARCVAGRATTCWKAYREGDQSKTPLVIKDSWQYPERPEEGNLLREATEKGVINVARHYHHQIVYVGDKVHDIRNNIRKGLDLTKATNYRPARSDVFETVDSARTDRTNNISVGRKRSSSSRTDPLLPPSKRTHSSSSIKGGRDSNRVHRRVIIRDYGKPIYEASSPVAMLAALEGCIEGYESLHIRAGILQGDVSASNLMMNEEQYNPSRSAFLIDLDLAIRDQRDRPSGARDKTGTRPFMAIGLLLGEKQSFMHALESFFWVLFWICIHYNGPGKEVGPTDFDSWNYEDDQKLALSKKGIVDDEGDFVSTADRYFTSYHKPLIPWVNKLRKVVFPNGTRRKDEDEQLYTHMKEILRNAREDPRVSGVAA
ncbi:hypothetical protein VTN00DRAFT_2733 [Thermoascus crustaceus]|uniref:uncharacterized protein n=1 Tax=Thermoascus crustaceus TaxID=5088 RepID=UPI003744B041